MRRISEVLLLPPRHPLLLQVWIPGGGYVSGAGSERFYRSEVLAAYGDVIVVTINYRLWPFGFFHTGDDRMTNGK